LAWKTFQAAIKRSSKVKLGNAAEIEKFSMG